MVLDVSVTVCTSHLGRNRNDTESEFTREPNCETVRPLRESLVISLFIRVSIKEKMMNACIVMYTHFWSNIGYYKVYSSYEYTYYSISTHATRWRISFLAVSSKAHPRRVFGRTSIFFKIFTKMYTLLHCNLVQLYYEQQSKYGIGCSVVAN